MIDARFGAMCGRLRIGKEKLHALVGGVRACFARCFRTHATPLVATSAPAPAAARVTARAQLEAHDLGAGTSLAASLNCAGVTHRATLRGN